MHRNVSAGGASNLATAWCRLWPTTDVDDDRENLFDRNGPHLRIRRRLDAALAAGQGTELRTIRHPRRASAAMEALIGLGRCSFLGARKRIAERDVLRAFCEREHLSRRRSRWVHLAGAEPARPQLVASHSRWGPRSRLRRCLGIVRRVEAQETFDLTCVRIFFRPTRRRSGRSGPDRPPALMACG